MQVGLSVQDVQKQRQWGCAEVRAYVLTEADFNIMLVQRHLPLWLQRRILGAGPAGSADAAMRALDANAEPYQHMAGCDRVSVDVALAPPVRLLHPSPGTRVCCVRSVAVRGRRGFCRCSRDCTWTTWQAGPRLPRAVPFAALDAGPASHAPCDRLATPHSRPPSRTHTLHGQSVLVLGRCRPEVASPQGVSSRCLCLHGALPGVVPRLVRYHHMRS